MQILPGINLVPLLVVARLIPWVQSQGAFPGCNQLWYWSFSLSGRRPNGFMGMSLIDRTILFLVILLDNTVSVGKESLCIRTLANNYCQMNKIYPEFGLLVGNNNVAFPSCTPLRDWHFLPINACFLAYLFSDRPPAMRPRARLPRPRPSGHHARHRAGTYLISDPSVPFL